MAAEEDELYSVTNQEEKVEMVDYICEDIPLQKVHLTDQKIVLIEEAIEQYEL